MPTVDNRQRRLLILAYHAQASLDLRHRSRGDLICCLFAWSRFPASFRLVALDPGRRGSRAIAIGQTLFLVPLSFEALALVRHKLEHSIDKLLPEPPSAVMTRSSPPKGKSRARSLL
jgi:hypothetical protein